MGRKGFSATTFVLVAVLIFALFMVGRAVNPPPPGPPEPPPKEPLAKTVDPKQEMNQRTTMMAQRLGLPPNATPAQISKAMKAQAIKAKKQQTNPTFNPDSIDVTNSYFGQTKMGEEGTKDLRERVAKAKAAQKAALQSGLHGAPAGAPPTATPPAAAPASSKSTQAQ